MEKTQEFGRLRSMLFPIYKSELRKFIPLTTIFFMISTIYSILRSLKDMFIMRQTAPEVIYYLKLFAVMPSIILLTILYSKVSKSTNRDGRFNAVIAYFLAFFALSYFYFIPNLEALKLNYLATLLNKNPQILKII
ncbi:MAG: Npt1/Npt2 family nucleotide transporter, partial [Bacteroidota bacterium]